MAANEQVNFGIADVGQTRPGDDFSGRLVFDDERIEFQFAILVRDEADSGPQNRPTVDAEVGDITLIITLIGIIENSGPDGVGVAGYKPGSFRLDVETVVKLLELDL